MISSSIFKTTLAVAGLVLLASCGGGNDDESGTPVELNVVPADLTVTAGSETPAGECVTGEGIVTVFINGGAAPYELFNPYPDTISLSTVKVHQRGGSFVVGLKGGCLKPGSILVKDALDRQVEFVISSVPASGTTTPAT